MHIWTEEPLKEIWRLLRYFRSPYNVYNLLTGKIDSGRPHKWKETENMLARAFDIAACVSQADEYYHAAGTVGLATEPLLQFYGAQCLSKACILSNDESIELKDINYHGLSTRPSTANDLIIQELIHYNKSDSIWEVESEFAVTHEGVFPFLCKIAGDNIPPKGNVVKVKELLRVVPEMADLFQRHYKITSHCFYLYTDEIIKGGRIEVLFSNKEAFESVRILFPEFSIGFETQEKPRHSFGFRSISDQYTSIPDYIKIVRGSVAGHYLVKPHESGVFTSLGSHYALLFILSNMVRYKPSFWMRVMEGDTTGSASIVETFINLSKRRIPGDVLELLWHENFTFGTPGYWV